MSQRPHARSGSHGRKGPLPSSRSATKLPALNRRGHSYASSVSQSTSGSPTKTNAHHSVLAYGSRQSDESDEDTMTGFLQFCATCERQIATPGHVLYCSEACRRKDLANSEDFATLIPSPPLTPLTMLGDVPHYPHIDIVPQRSPTVLRPLSLSFADLSMAEQSLADDWTYSQQNSQQTARSAHSLSTMSSRNEYRYFGDGQNQSSRASESCIPSLSHTPSSSCASAASYQRPRISRNPYTSSFTTKSIDLVLPRAAANTTSSSPVQHRMSISAKSSASTLTSFRVVEAERGSFVGSLGK